MQGIKNKPFIDAAPFLPMDELMSMEKEICLGIAKSKINAGIYGPGVRNEDQYKSIISLIQHYSKSNDRCLLENLTLDQMSMFFKLYEGMYSASTVVYIRDYKDKKSLSTYMKKAQADATYYTDNAQFFPNLIPWIEKLPFDEIGRVLFFIHEHDCTLLTHRDGPRYVPHKNEFLWLNPCQKKSFFIYDDKNDVKHYVDTTAAFFNDLDEHGGDPVPRMTWSLRIDGKFTKKFRKQLKIDQLQQY
jgi:hypothetical protein